MSLYLTIKWKRFKKGIREGIMNNTVEMNSNLIEENDTNEKKIKEKI